MTMLTSGAAPCKRCGSEGGPTKRDKRVPARIRGLCKKCYDRILNAGGLDAYPCIERARAVVCLPPAGDLATLIPIPRDYRPWRGAWKADEWSRTVAYEVARGTEWLRRRGLAA